MTLEISSPRAYARVRIPRFPVCLGGSVPSGTLATDRDEAADQQGGKNHEQPAPNPSGLLDHHASLAVIAAALLVEAVPPTPENSWKRMRHRLSEKPKPAARTARTAGASRTASYRLAIAAAAPAMATPVARFTARIAPGVAKNRRVEAAIAV